MEFGPIVGKPVRFPSGRVDVRLTAAHRRAYRRLYAAYRTNLDGLPILRDRDFDGRAVRMTARQLEALNKALAELAVGDRNAKGVFAQQESARVRLFKRLQYLS
jgi:hypothetical protein